MSKLAKTCNVDKISLSVDTTNFEYPRSIPKLKVFFKLWEDVLMTTYPPFRNAILRAAANDVCKTFVHIYTEGSKDPNTGKTGMSFYVEPLPPMDQARLNDNISVYSTELTAILHALIWIKSNSGENSKFVIFSDRLSALMTIGGSDSVRKDLINNINRINKAS